MPYGIDNPKPKKPDNWEEIKHGFTQAHGCSNCDNRWSEQLEWDQPAINSVRMHNYCSDCNNEKVDGYE